jgi:glycosyltransferase involved in cell wall biosynthesis
MDGGVSSTLPASPYFGSAGREVTRQFDFFATGPRMQLLPARALYKEDLLGVLHFGDVRVPSWAARPARALIGKRAREREIRDIPTFKLRSHPDIRVLWAWRQIELGRHRSTAGIESLIVRRFRSIARQCASPAVFGLQSSALELFKDRDRKVMEQCAPPLRAERLLHAEEAKRFPGWAGSAPPPAGWEERQLAEWELADIVWAPSEFVVDSCVGLGAERSKFRVVPYPVPRVTAQRDPSGRRTGPLRVIFAGTLQLEKGVQYIYEAFKDGVPKSIELHFFGRTQISESAIACLRRIGTVHGPVPRSTLLAEYGRSDMLLFPSLSEGSALVTLEATAWGLPVIATPEAGAPGSALLIPSRNPAAIRTAVEALAENPGEIASLSRAGLREAAGRTEDAFQHHIADVARVLAE